MWKKSGSVSLEEGVAYHEAGHFVAAMFVTGPRYEFVHHLTIIPDPKVHNSWHNGRFVSFRYDGRMYSLPTRNARLGGVKPQKRGLEWVCNEIMIALAGGIAEKRFTGRRPKGTYGDDREALAWARQVQLNIWWSSPLLDPAERAKEGRAVNAMLRWLRLCAEILIAKHWDDVVTVANLLLKKGKVSGKEARLAMESAREKRAAALAAEFEPPPDYDYWEEEARRLQGAADEDCAEDGPKIRLPVYCWKNGRPAKTKRAQQARKAARRRAEAKRRAEIAELEGP
jgi:hypothetical protein